MPLTSRFAVSVDLSLTDTTVDSTTIEAPRQIREVLRMLTGTAAGQADKAWWDTRSLGPSATETLDLAGVLIDPVLKTALTFVKVKALYVKAAATNLNNLSIGANVTNGWATLIGPTGASGGVITLRPGWRAIFFSDPADTAGAAVTAGTGDLINAVNLAGTNTISYDIAVVGCSA